MLRVMTMNLNYYHNRYGEWDERKHLIIQAIETHKPHVIALQAVRQEPDRYQGLDQAAQLTHELHGYPHATFQPAYAYEDGSMDGSAFLSQFRILETDFQPLTFSSGLEDPNHRIVLHGLFDLPECPLHLFNAHFSWVEDQARQNIAEALTYAGCFKGYKTIVGDLNTNAGSTLFEAFTNNGWTDAWMLVHGKDQGLTYDSRSPSMRIDYIWVDSELKDRVHDVQIIAKQAGQNDIHASDHFGLIATFENW